MTQGGQSNQEQVFAKARFDLTRRADESIRELIAFDEISSSETVKANDTLARWIENNWMLLDSKARTDFEHSMDELIESLNKARDSMAEEGGSRTISMSPDIPRNDADAAFVQFMVMLNLQRADRAAIVGRAFLIAAESSFEVLFGQLARAVYAKNPAALPKSDHAFTLEEMSSYNSIEEARDALIDRKIEALLRESPDEWTKWLKRTVGISMDDVIGTWPRLREIFTRRNMLVHTDGNVTERYLTEVRRSGGNTDGLRVGQSLIPTPDYLKSALQQLVAFETLLVCKVLSHIDKPGADEMTVWLGSNLDLTVTTGRWDAACLIADSFSGVACQRDTKLKIDVLGWLAHKNRDGVDHIRKQVSEWDISGLHEDYRVTKKILLDQLTADELSEVVASGRITRFEVLTDPLFASVRDLLPLSSS